MLNLKREFTLFKIYKNMFEAINKHTQNDLN
jgi:hypothetical protein